MMRDQVRNIRDNTADSVLVLEFQFPPQNKPLAQVYGKVCLIRKFIVLANIHVV